LIIEIKTLYAFSFSLIKCKQYCEKSIKSNQSTLSIFKAQKETKFFFKHDTELRDGYNYTAQPKIAFILGDICMLQGAAFKMQGIGIAFEFAFAVVQRILRHGLVSHLVT